MNEDKSCESKFIMCKRTWEGEDVRKTLSDSVTKVKVMWVSCVSFTSLGKRK